MAKRKIAKVTHVTAHIGTATCRPELKDLVSRLAEEYGLMTWDDLTSKGVKYAGGWGSNNDTPEQRAAALAEKLGQLGPGTWIIVEHPGLDTPEMKALGHPGSANIARARSGVTQAFTSPEVKRIVTERGIRVPTIAWWPGTVKPGSVSDFPSVFYDWLPTFAELAATELQSATDGVSLVPTLQGNADHQQGRGYIFWDYERTRTPRKGHWTT